MREQPLFLYRKLLLEYKNMTLEGRKELLSRMVKDISEAPADVPAREKAAETYGNLTTVATLINYANALYNIENQDYFDILMALLKIEWVDTVH